MKMRVDDFNRQFYQRIQNMLDLPSIDDAATLAKDSRNIQAVRALFLASCRRGMPGRLGDPFNLKGRFVDKQRTVFQTAVKEIRSGSKKTHWMWFVIPTPPYIDVCGKEQGR